MATDEESPLIKALPPASDYLTYLTIVEYNLTAESLPVLHKVLQDEALATNIGWDLVHLLVPFLPESEECLIDIAKLGNPREVILKVTESLRLIEYDDVDQEDVLTDDPEHAADVRAGTENNTHPMKTAPIEGAHRNNESTASQMVELPPPLPLAINQFAALLDMLAILHSRIKTRYPSRFLSTTLQAILASFSNSSICREEMVHSIVKTIKTISGIRRPALPNRRSSGMVSSSATRGGNTPKADPEAMLEDSSKEESAMQRKLMQSFATHVLEEYLLNFQDHDNVPGMAWCSRIMEKLHTERIIPDTKTFADRFANEEMLGRRIDAVGQLSSLAQDLKISDEQLLSAAAVVDKIPENRGGEDDPPDSAEEIPLSRLGSLLLFAGRQVSGILYDRDQTSQLSFEIFPNHQNLLKQCLSAHGMGSGQLGTEPEALIDSVLALGLVCLERNAIGEPETDKLFTDYLQVTALLSSNCPNANLRGHAHYLTSTILRSQPDEQVRLAFIRDTLEHCPFENLKVSAVGWIKGETIEANPPGTLPGHELRRAESDNTKSVFAKSLALDSLSPYLFPSLEVDLVAAPIQEAWMTFQTNVSFYLASLNFIYLLLQAKHVHGNLDIPELWNNYDIAGSFLQPLRDSKARFLHEMRPGGALMSEKSDEKHGGTIAGTRDGRQSDNLCHELE